jgi:hypothetical protein
MKKSIYTFLTLAISITLMVTGVWGKDDADKLMNRVAALEAAVVALQTENNQQQKDIGDLKVALTTAQNDIAKLESALEIAQSDISALKTDLGSEASARQDADNNLANLIDTEKSARLAADDLLVAAIDDEQITRFTEDTKLANDLNAETEARINADDALADLLDIEKAARIAGDTNLASDIDEISIPDNLLDLADYVSIDLDPMEFLTGPHIIFEGANVHIRSGTGKTDDYSSSASGNTGTLTGLGNLIVGYNEASLFAGGVVGAGDRSGSHNLILGFEHKYTSWGGIVGGFRNTVSGYTASVIAGNTNTASGNASSVSGGQNNVAIGPTDTVVGDVGRTYVDDSLAH